MHLQTLLAASVLWIICCQALRLDQVARPGCTVGVIADEHELMDQTGTIGQFLKLELHDVVTCLRKRS